jgi:hypothetical protein
LSEGLTTRCTTLTPTPSWCDKRARVFTLAVLDSCLRSQRSGEGATLCVFPGALEMAEAITINDQELAIICDLMAGWGAKWDGKLDDNKRQALDQVIAKGFVEPSDERSLTRYRHTAKASQLLAELCVGISGG